MGTGINAVEQYLTAGKNIMEYFNCNDEFFIKALLDFSWSVIDNKDFSLLSYWDGKKKVDSVVVRKNGLPLIFETKEYTMVVAIDCVKIGFVLKNDNRVEI